MVICKFFQEGRCRFGANCRNEHITSSRDNSNYQQPNKQQYFQQPQQRPRDENQQDINLESLLYVVKDDATNSMNGGQWLLSCYAPLLRKFSKISFNNNEENLPGLIDYSPEELHWEAINSNAAGQFHDYTMKLQQLSQSYQTIQRALQNLDQATANFIVRYERGENVSPMGTALGGSSASLPTNNVSTSGSNQFSFSLPPTLPQQPAVAPFRFQMPPQQPAPATSFSFQLPPQQPPSGGAPFSFKLPTQVQAQQLGQPAPFSFQLPAQQQVQQPNQSVNSTSLPTNNFVRQGDQNNLQATLQSTTHQQLDPSHLEQFKAEKFSFGKIPRVPPPRELCV